MCYKRRNSIDNKLASAMPEFYSDKSYQGLPGEKSPLLMVSVSSFVVKEH